MKINKGTLKKILVLSAFSIPWFISGCASTSEAKLNQKLSTSHVLTPEGVNSNLRGIDMIQKVSFKRDGLTIVGNLFTPKNFDVKDKYKAVIIAGSLSSVKEQMAGTYGQKFAENGFISLVIDYSHYGESEGQPRQYESPDEKLRDLKAAVTYLKNLPYVQEVGMVGVCTSAGNAAYLAASENRVKALATVAGFYPSPELSNKMFGQDEIARRRALGEEAEKVYEKSGEQITIPVYSNQYKTAVNYNPTPNSYDYYMNKTRGGVPQWKNEFAVMSFSPWLDFDSMSKAPEIKIPTIVVHSDGSAFPDQAKKFYSQLGGLKELKWGDGNHYNYYDQPAQIDFAVHNIAIFFNEHMH